MPASPNTDTPLTVKAMTKAATKNTTTAPKELETSLELLGDYTIDQLKQGHSVRVGDLGIIRVTFKSEGAEDIRDFNALSMIKNPRILFTPSKEFREAVINGLQFQDGGVLDEGVNYASLADYKRAKNLTDLPTENVDGGETGGSDPYDPLEG